MINPTNTHKMVTRSKLGVFKPRVVTAEVSIESRTMKEALSRLEWVTTMKEECEALMRNGTWSLVSLPQGRRPIGCKWLLKTKRNSDGSINKLKLRLVAQGFLQRERFNFTDRFSHVVKPTTIRTILSITFAKGWHLHKLHVNNVS